MQTNQDLLDESFIDNSVPRTQGQQDLVNDTSVYYKGMVGLILCIFPGAIIGLVFVKISLDQGKAALEEYATYPNKYREQSLQRVKSGRTMAYIGLAFFIVEILAILAVV